MIVSNKTRRQFLKNFSIASLSVGLFPVVAQANRKEQGEVKSTTSCDVTTRDYYGEGPFYTLNPPTIQNNMLAGPSEPGVRLVLSGQVRNLDCTELIQDTEIDIWHANDAGTYDTTGFNLRGITHSNSQGFYVFETVLPGHYLNGANYRPAHIHLKITPPGFNTLTTQLYFEGDQYIPIDAAASITSGQFDATHRIIPITLNTDGKYEGTWDIVVDGNGIAGMNDLHLEKGMIYSASPNPFTDTLNIHYGVFRNSNISLWVYDLQGRTVAKLEEKSLPAQKYTAVWQPDSALPNGYYFIALKINDIQVHYVKVLKQS